MFKLSKNYFQNIIYFAILINLIKSWLIQISQSLKNTMYGDMQVENSVCQGYSDSYAKVGFHFTNLPIENDLPMQIANFLPDNYRAVDLGSNNGKFAFQTQQICQSKGKKGIFWSIDPYPTNPEVLRMTSEEFMQNQEYDNLDFLLSKHSIHFNSNHDLFFKNSHKSMKDNGIFVIVQLGSNIKLPWTQPFYRTFHQKYVKATDVIPTQLFEYQSFSQQKEFHCSKQLFIQFIKGKSWSTILLNTQQEIEDCIEKIKNMEEFPPLKIPIWKYVLRKKKI